MCEQSVVHSLYENPLFRVDLAGSRGFESASLDFPLVDKFCSTLGDARGQIVGCMPHPDDAFMREVGRTMTATDEGALASCQVLICDRDQK